MSVEFVSFPKIPRLTRNMVVTEKIDGTNAAVQILDCSVLDVPREEPGWVVDPREDPSVVAVVGALAIFAQSRTRLITPGKSTDNFGFAAWVKENADELVKLGPGVHFGEWWGLGIQRGYGLTEKRFSLFNVGRWEEPYRAFLAGETTAFPNCVSIVPVLARHTFSDTVIGTQLERLRTLGSVAAPGFMRPEGICVYHEASGGYFKKLLENDDQPKGARA